MADPDGQNAALTRGLAIVEAVSRASGPLRFSELRAVIGEISDSSLARLLRSLESSGHLQRDADEGYKMGRRLAAWQAALRVGPTDWRVRLQVEIQQLCQMAHESAAAAYLQQDQITVAYGQTVEGGVTVMRTGTLLHFEADHAGSLAILAALPANLRNQLLVSRFSRIPDREEYRVGVEEARRGKGLWLDRSRERPGISRLAVALTVNGRPGSLFFCLPTESALARYGQLSTALLEARERLET